MHCNSNYDVRHLVSCALRLHDAVRPTIRELRLIAFETMRKRVIVHFDSVTQERCAQHARVLARR